MASGISITALILSAIAILLAIIFIIIGFSSNTSGPTGSPGPIGSTGPTGADGLPGTASNTGATGFTGATGPQGVPGIASNTGATGSTGPIGEQGPTGQNGQDGGIGPPGLQGPIGPTGPPGGSATNIYGRMYRSDRIFIPMVDPKNAPTGPDSSNTPLIINFPLANINGTLPSGCYYCNANESNDQYSVTLGSTYLFEYGASFYTRGQTQYYLWLADLMADQDPNNPGWSGNGSSYYQGGNLNPLPGSVLCLPNGLPNQAFVPFTTSYIYTVPTSYANGNTFGIISLVAAVDSPITGVFQTISGQNLVNGVSVFITATKLA